MRMKNILKNRLALSTVITTLIILVVAVLLAGVVTYFAINVVSTRVQQESLSVSCLSVWVDSAGKSQAALLITNTGGRDVVISQIEIRGIAATIGHTGQVSFELNVAGTVPNALSPLATIAATNVFGTGDTTTSLALPAAGTTELVLTSGSTMAVYIADPTGVGVNDIGTTIGLTVFTSQAMYYQEANVQTTSIVLP